MRPFWLKFFQRVEKNPTGNAMEKGCSFFSLPFYIEKRSSELWQVLSTFKTEFEKFVQLLLKTQSKLGEANSTIEQATKSSKKIAKKLGDVSQVVGIDYDKNDDDNGTDEIPNIED